MKRLGRLLRTVLAVIGAIVVLVQFSPLVFWWATWLAGPWDDPQGDVLIVLGASIEDQHIISLDTYQRSLHAILAWQQGGVRKIVVCGNGPGQIMKEFMVFSGIPPDAIIAETKSLSTHENALQATALLESDPGRKILMTSDFHMFRASRAFRKLGLKILPRPIPDARSRALRFTQRWGSFIDVTEESLKILYYWAKGWI